jgi:osmotically-inducible protein OsmY
MIVVLAACAAMGCTKPETTGSAAADDTAADNTKKNERDQHAPGLTSGDQAENESDRTITQLVRQSVVKGDNISVAGKNVKIITQDGVVTLRGPVKTAQEKIDIAAVAKQTDGVKSVDNQLEVAAN